MVLEQKQPERLHLRTDIVVSTIVVLLLGGVLALLSYQPYSWSRWQPATCRPNHCFCETIRDASIAQPANALSSLGFIFVGLMIVLAEFNSDPRRQYTNRMVREPIYTRSYGCALILIGLGSAFYHASLTFVGQICDVSGMYVLITFALLYSMTRFKTVRPAVFLGSYLFLNLLLLWLQVSLPNVRRYAFAALVLILLFLELRARRRQVMSIESKWLWRSAAIMGVAFGIWILDITRVACFPGSILQGHAIWHLLGALAAWCLYRYYRSEVSVES